MKSVSKYVAVSLFAVISAGLFGQDNVPLGIHYQAVARDNYGNELVNRKISVKFSIIKDDPLGEVVYQELYQDILTSRFGVFSLIIGHGTPTGNSPCGELSQISWESAFHFLKVEVKFENDFMDMGTMQFLAVPYALYARKSLEPGPAGPKGDAGPKGEPGDPASDDQTLSFDGSTLSIGGGNSLSLTDLLQNLTVEYQTDGTYLGISRGNSVKLATIEADGDPKNELQDLTISSDKLKITNNTLATEWDLSPYRQSLLWDPSARVISISGTNSTVNLSELENDADADPVNEIQDLALSGNLLTISENPASPGVDLAKYLDDTDDQQLSFNSVNNTLILTGNDPVDLSSLENDADADATNEIQSLSYDPDNYQLTLDKDGGQAVIGQIIAFRAGIATLVTLPNNVSVDLVFNNTTGSNFYNEGNYYNSGVFLVPHDGIYSFSVSLNLPANSSIILEVDGNGFETLVGPTTSSGSFKENITMKLIKNNAVNISIIQTNGFDIPSYSINGYFSGYRIY